MSPLAIGIAISPIFEGVDADNLVGNNLEFVDGSNILFIDGSFFLQVAS